MKNTWIFAAGIAVTLSAFARDVEIASFDPAQLHLRGSACAFERKPRATVLASDWAGKFWIKVDGKLIELVSQKTDDEAERELARKRWRETLRGADLTVKLSLVELRRGVDSAAFKGYLEVRRRGSSTRIPIIGGCGA